VYWRGDWCSVEEFEFWDSFLWPYYRCHPIRCLYQRQL
jgi:hypothetical protein